MEEDTIQLSDYLRVIWKRKIFFIVGALVCSAAGIVVVMRAQVTYRADAVIDIGRKASLQSPSSPTFPTLVIIEPPGDLVESIPLRYGSNKEKDFGYHVDAKKCGETSMVNVVMSGPDRRTVKKLKAILNRLFDDHRRTIETSIVPYNSLLKERIVNAERIKERMRLAEARIGVERRVEVGEDANPYVRLLRRDTEVRVERSLENNRENLSAIQQEILLLSSFIDGFKELNTKQVGEVEEISVKTKIGRKIMLIMVGGLMMLLFLVFFLEYLEKIIKKEKERGKI